MASLLPQCVVPATLILLLTLARFAVRRRRTTTLLHTLRGQQISAVGPDGRRVSGPLATHLWHWTDVSPDLLSFGVRAVSPDLEGDGPLRCLESEAVRRREELTAATRLTGARRRRHEMLMASHAQLTAGMALSAPVLNADGVYDALSTGLEAGAVPVPETLDGASLGPLADAMPVLGMVGVVDRTVRRSRAGQDLRTAVGVSAAEAALRSGGAAAMGKAGAVVGSVIGPVGTVVGAGVGAILGSMVGLGLAQRNRWKKVRSWEEQLQVEYRHLGAELAGSATRRHQVRRELSSEYRHVGQTLRVVRGMARRRACHPRHWVQLDPQVVLLREVARCGTVETRQERRDLKALRRFVRRAEPARVAALLAHDTGRCERLGCNPERLKRAQELNRRIQVERTLLR